MTIIEEHLRKIKEHLEEIEDAVDQGIENKPVTIGFHCPACALQLLELYLHSLNKISIGKVVKHDWFKRPQEDQKIESLIERKLSVDFPMKEEIYELIYDLEDKRNTLVYGKPMKIQIERVYDNFLKLKEILKELLKNERISI